MATSSIESSLNEEKGWKMITAHKITRPFFARRDPSPPLVKKNPKNREPIMSVVRNLYVDHSDTQMSILAPSIDSYQ